MCVYENILVSTSARFRVGQQTLLKMIWLSPHFLDLFLHNDDLADCDNLDDDHVKDDEQYVRQHKNVLPTSIKNALLHSTR